MRKRNLLTFSIIAGIVLGLAFFKYAEAKPNYNDYANQPSCQSHPHKNLAWTLESAWMSTNYTGDWKTDNWFYQIKPYQPVYVLNSDYRLRYYFVCFQFDPSWTPLYGWVKMDNILLNSDVK